MSKRPRFVEIHFDGGRRSNKASCGVAVFLAFELESDAVSHSLKFRTLSIPLGDVTVVQAELRGAYEAVLAAIALINSWPGGIVPSFSLAK